MSTATVERCVAGGQLEQDGRGDVVRQVADDDESLACARLAAAAAKSKLSTSCSMTVTVVGGKLHAQMQGEVVVELDGDDVMGARGECAR